MTIASWHTLVICAIREVRHCPSQVSDTAKRNTFSARNTMPEPYGFIAAGRPSDHLCEQSSADVQPIWGNSKKERPKKVELKPSFIFLQPIKCPDKLSHKLTKIFERRSRAIVKYSSIQKQFVDSCSFCNSFGPAPVGLKNVSNIEKGMQP